MPQTSKSIERYCAYVVNDDILDRVEKIFSEFQDEPPTYTLGCSDGSSISDQDSGFIKGFPNVATRRVTSLEVSSEYGGPLRLGISFRGGEYSEVRISATGDDEVVLSAISKLNEVYLLSRKWYSRISSGSPGSTGLISGIIIALGLIALIALGSIVEDLVSGVVSPVELKTSATLAVALAAICVVAIYYFRKWFFPPSVFLFGAGTDRYQNSIRLRQTSLGFLVSLFAGAVIWAIS